MCIVFPVLMWIWMGYMCTVSCADVDLDGVHVHCVSCADVDLDWVHVYCVSCADAGVDEVLYVQFLLC